MPGEPTPTNQRLLRLNQRWLACRGCDAIWSRISVPEGHEVRCPRCDSPIAKNRPLRADRSLALLLASLVLIVLVATFPFLKVEASGLGNEISIIEAVRVLWDSGFQFLSAGVALLVFVFPLCRVAVSALIAWRVLGHQSFSLPVRRLMAFNQSIAPWAMAEIFLLGVVVTMVKVSMLADIELGAAFWSLAAFVVAMGIGFSAMSSDALWADSRESL